MTVKEKMTAPVTSVGADVEQPLENLNQPKYSRFAR